MATQRVILAKIAGRAAQLVFDRFASWPTHESRSEADPRYCKNVDDFIDNLRANAHLPPILFFNEWIDHWSMGDLLPALGNEPAKVAYGERFQVSIHQLPLEVAKDFIGGRLTQECKWLRARVRDAVDAWKPLVEESAILVAREPLGGSLLDEELEASLRQVPSWIAAR